MRKYKVGLAIGDCSIDIEADSIEEIEKYLYNKMTNKEFELKDSGQRQEFSTGARRDTDDNKPGLELISPIFLNRLGHWLTEGRKKYGKGNWSRGLPIDRCMGSLLRHINAYREGLTDEDHLAAAACNLMFIIHIEEMIKRGKLPKELDDMPIYI